MGDGGGLRPSEQLITECFRCKMPMLSGGLSQREWSGTPPCTGRIVTRGVDIFFKFFGGRGTLVEEGV